MIGSMAMMAAQKDTLAEMRGLIDDLEKEVLSLRAKNEALVAEKLSRESRQSQAASDDAWAVWGSE